MPDRQTPAQIRAARGLLDWTMLDLARAAGVSVSTVKRLEDGATVRVSDGIGDVIRRALEAEGVEFLSDASRTGVLLRQP